MICPSPLQMDTWPCGGGPVPQKQGPSMVAPDVLSLDWLALTPRIEERRDEVDDLMNLLRDHADMAAGSEEELKKVIWSIACACLGDRHLWQDLGLASRCELSSLIEHWFPKLAECNAENMKWKKFFYRQLCLREGLLICKAPTCGVCTDQQICFGFELA